MTSGPWLRKFFGDSAPRTIRKADPAFADLMVRVRRGDALAAESLSPCRSWLNTLARSWFDSRPVRPKRHSRPLMVKELEARLTPNTYVSKLTLWEREVEALGGEVLDLTCGYPDGLVSEWMRAAFERTSNVSYQPEIVTALKESVAGYFQSLLAWEPVLLASTASEALLVAIDTAIREPGDEVLLLDNGFDTYPGFVATCKGNPVFVPRGVRNELDVEALEARISPRARAVLVTQPENPLGLVHRSRILQRLAHLCSSRGLVLIMDCAFLELSPWQLKIPIITRLKRPSNLEFLVIGDTGKIISYRGLRLGALAVSPGLRDRAVERFANLFARLDLIRLHFLASTLADRRLSSHKRWVNEIFRRNHDWLKNRLDPRIEVARNEATTFATLEISELGVLDTEFAAELLQAERVALVPGSLFFKADPNPPRHRLRVALARQPQVIREAVERINRFVAKRCPTRPNSSPAGAGTGRG